MYLLGLGIVLVLMKYLGVSPVAAWLWWWTLIPFGLAVAWWSWADATGYTKRKIMQQEDRRKQERLDKNREALGLGIKQKR